MAGVSYFNVYVTHVVETIECQERPNYCNLIFWGQKDRGLSTKMEEQIRTFNFESSPRPLLTDLKKEKIFCVLVNNSWLRATISDYSVDRNGSLEVFCIDYGHTVMVPLPCIKLIPSTMNFISSCHPLASKFLLADAVVEKGVRGKEPVLQYLQRNVANKNVKAVSLGNRDDFEGVRIYLNDVLVAKLLVENHLATTATTYAEAVREPIPNHRQLSVSSISPPPMTKNSYRAPSAMSVSHKMLNIASLPSKANPGGSYAASCLETNALHTVMVTYVQNGPQKFVIQRKNSDAVEKLKHLSQKISDFAALNSKTLVNPERGTPCIAISSRDKLFHRAVVTLVEDVRYAQVYFVDYGYSELVDLQSLFEIPPDFVATELFAYRVTLEDAASLMTFDKVSENFTRLVLYQTFKCHVTGETIPQSVILMDDAGRTVKEMVLASLADPRPPLNISELLKTTSLSPIHPVGNIKISQVEVRAEEDLFVTYVGSPGKFFGQFERREVTELEDLKNELHSTYSYSSCIPGQVSQIPLLYADAKSHIGDYAVIKWSSDGHFYRVQVVNEFANDVSVTFVDYGNVIKVSRQEIWAPVSSLKLFSKQPFGINCLIPGITLTENEWTLLISDKSIRVKLAQPINKVYPATFVNFPINNINRPLSACSNLSPIAPEFDPSAKSGKTVVPQVTNRRLDFDATGQSGLRNTIPNIVSNQNVLEDSWGNPINQSRVLEDSRILEDSWGMPVLSSKGLVVDPASPKTDGASSVSSNASRNQVEQMDWESAEPKELPRQPTSVSHPLDLPKRVMPISQPIKFVYPSQKGLEGATKSLEIVFVENPNSFYCHSIEAVPLLEKLMADLATAYQTAHKEPLGCFDVGVACVAQYTDDGGWYRGQILNVGATEVEVLFVDYGNKQNTPTTLLKAIEWEFVKLPPQAYHCSLAGVQDGSRSWTSQDKTRFEQVGMGKPLTATVSHHCENEKYSVRLVDESSSPHVVINDLFAPPREIVPVPDVFSYSSLPTSELTNVNIAWFCNVGRFFLSPVDLTSYQLSLDELEEYYTALPSDELFEDSPSVGLPCVVKFKDDSRFYRSQILSIRGQFATVLFVDYGNEQETALKELKRIHPRFLIFPQLTWQCRLNNVNMPNSEILYSEDLKAHIDACFPQGPNIAACFHGLIDGVYEVDLAVPDIGDVANYLVKNKVLCRHSNCTEQGKEVKFPPQNLNFVPDQIISTNAFLPFVKTPLEFWVQLEPESVDAIMEQSDTLANQPDFLNSKNNFVPVVGKSCLAFFTDDGRWYRATVESLEGNSAVVCYVDYGNTSSVALEHLRALPPSLAEKPAMAFKCCLDTVESPISSEVTDAFLNQALDLVATVKFIKVVNEILCVRLMNTANGVDLGEKIQLPSKPVELEVYVAYSISPEKFWIQRKQDEDKIAEIQDQLFKELQGSNLGSFQVQGQPIVGQMYAVDHPVYHTLYRALMKSFDSFSGLAEIQFVDYGDNHKVSEADFLHLPDNLKHIPPMAIESCLNLQSKPKHWPEEALKYFNSICSPEVVFKAKLGAKTDGVQLIDSMQAPTENVTEMLNLKIKQSQVDQAGRILDILDSVSKTTKQVETHPVIRPSTELINDMDGYPGQVISSKAIAVCLTSPTAVWLHLDPSAADDVMECIKQYVQKPEFAQIGPIEPLIGVSCLALFLDDQLWYRAIVESVDQNSVTVKYVDFGNSSPVGKDQLRPIPPSLVIQPALALKCALDGADRISGDLPPTNKCQDAIFNQILSVTFTEKTQKHIFVRLRDSDGNDLNNQLGLPAASNNAKPENQRTSASSTQISSRRPIPGAEDVRVSYIKSASMFWIQRESNSEEIEQIRDTLRPLDANDSPNVPPASVKENVLYAVMHPEYNRFFRAQAKQISGDSVEVYFLDIGFSDWVPLSSVRPCPAILKYIPAMANECTFRSPIYPDQYCEEICKAFSGATEGVVCQAVFSAQPTQGVQCIESLFAKGVNVGNLLYNLISSIGPQSGTSGGFGK